MTPDPSQTTSAAQTVTRAPVDLLAILRETELSGEYRREIIESQLSVNRFDQDWRLATVFSKSGLFADAQEVNQAMAKIQMGRSWNMTPSDSMQFVEFFNGKPSVRNEYLGSKMRDAGLDWEIEWHRDDKGVCTGCTLWPSRLQADGSYKPIMDRKGSESVPASVSFTKAHADRIPAKEDGKWIKLSEKSTYQSYPEDLYFWKSIARLKRRYATNVLAGVVTRDELEEMHAPIEPATREKQISAASDFTPGRQARRKAGAEEIPGTVNAGSNVTETKPAEVETKPDITETHDPTSTAPILPWKNATDMKNAFTGLQARVGPKAFSDTLASIGATVGDLKPEGGKSVEFYEALKALPDEPVTVAFPWSDKDSMADAFRKQRDRIGAPKFTEILNSKPGFMFGASSHADPIALEIYKAMEAVKVSDVVSDKRKLF